MSDHNIIPYHSKTRGVAYIVLFVMAWALGASGRSDRVLSAGWKFAARDVAGAELPAFDDSAWESVSVPHTWNALDGQDGGNNYRRGPSWYRLHLPVKKSLAGKTLFLYFEAAATVAEVFVNGTHLGHHAGNFGAFCFEATNLLPPDSDNVVAVRVDNSHRPDVPPLSGDFTIFGGLYRPVHLIALDPLSISPLDDASAGVYWKQESVSPASAELDVTAMLRNAMDNETTARVCFVLLDRRGRVVRRAEQTINAAAETTTPVAQKLFVANPHLWDGRNDPYLYDAVVEVYKGAKLTDRVDQQIGLRSFRADPDKGLMLNGKPYALHGVNRHQDRLNKGWAISDADHEEDCRIMLDMGCTVVRLAHYQQSHVIYDLCDKNGLIVWAELALVDKISTSPRFMENARQQLTELIKQNYNHPSICFWSLFNELGFPKNRPDDYWRPIAELNSLARQLDPTRPTTAASHLPEDTAINRVPDLLGINKYIGWNRIPLDQWGPILDDLHTSYSGRALAISEYGAGASVAQHDVPTTKTKPASNWHSEEWQSAVHEAAWRAMKDRHWLWATFVWNAFDFACDSRNEGDHAGLNDKGLATYDRKIKKDAYFFYQANWTSQPMVYIASRRFAERPAGTTEVTVYSNCNRVELRVNGKRIRPAKPDDIHVARWGQVDLKPGANQIEAIGHNGGKDVVDRVHWTVLQPRR